MRARLSKFRARRFGEALAGSGFRGRSGNSFCAPGPSYARYARASRGSWRARAPPTPLNCGASPRPTPRTPTPRPLAEEERAALRRIAARAIPGHRTQLKLGCPMQRQGVFKLVCWPTARCRRPAFLRIRRGVPRRPPAARRRGRVGAGRPGRRPRPVWASRPQERCVRGHRPFHRLSGER